MRLSKLSTYNYRTLEQLNLSFESYYSAICGKNDSGKTNVVRAIRCLMKESTPFGFGDDPECSLQTDFTKWVEEDSAGRSISITLDFVIDAQRDAGLFKFFQDYLSLGKIDKDLTVAVTMTHGSDAKPSVKVLVRDEEFDGLKAQEVLNRLQKSNTFLFHSSTDPRPSYYRGRFHGILRDVAMQHSDQLEQSKKNVNRVVARIAKGQQQEVESLLGRLSQKYKVSISYPTFDLSYVPYDLALGDKKVAVELNEWGSGTRNRTEILLTIFHAKQISEAAESAAKATPIIVVEEPESFLHPLAQAEFGRILQDLAEEFRVQIIVTTHSPYLLSQERPDSNILLERKVVRNQLRETIRIDTSDQKWMEPFALALGITNKEFSAWRDLFFSSSRRLLLVEGKTDAEYFTLLRDTSHGANQLTFDGDIFVYEGRDTLKNQALLKFIKDKFSPMFITFDLDSISIVEQPLKALGFENKKSYCAIGIDAAGKRCIEGLLPDAIRTAVYSENPDLVQALGGTKEEKNSAMSRLKKLLLDRFKQDAVPGQDYFGNFYPVVKVINRALK